MGDTLGHTSRASRTKTKARPVKRHPAGDLRLDECIVVEGDVGKAVLH